MEGNGPAAHGLRNLPIGELSASALCLSRGQYNNFNTYSLPVCAIICIDSGLPLTNGHPRMPWLRRVSSSPVVCSWLAVGFKPQPHAPSASFRQRISIEMPEYFARRSCTLGGEKKREKRDISLYMLTSRPPNYRSRLSASTLGTIKTAKLPSRLCYIRSKVRGWCVSIILNVRSLLIPPIAREHQMC